MAAREPSAVTSREPTELVRVSLVALHQVCEGGGAGRPWAVNVNQPPAKHSQRGVHRTVFAAAGVPNATAGGVPGKEEL